MFKYWSSSHFTTYVVSTYNRFASSSKVFTWLEKGENVVNSFVLKNVVNSRNLILAKQKKYNANFNFDEILLPLSMVREKEASQA